MIFSNPTTKVAITGIAEAGKTTFLTSLLWHLDQIGSGKLEVRNGKNNPIDIYKAKINDGKITKRTFQYKQVIAEVLHTREFPQKTADWRECSVEFAREGWWYNRQRLEFVDFPGERIVDVALMAYSSFDQWSAHFFEAVANVPQLTPYINEYKTKIQTSTDAAACIRAYKELIEKIIGEYGSLVSPSTLLLDEKGKTWKDKIKTASGKLDKQQFIPTAVSGLLGFEFAPIPVELVPTMPFTRQFKKNYERYRKKALFPLIKQVFRADKLLVLINIPELLMEGGEAYNQAVATIEALVTTLDPAGSFWKGFAIWSGLYFLGWNPVPLREVIFVATQTDRIHPDDINNDKIVRLLGEMVGGIISKVRPLKCQKTHCAAIQSTYVPPKSNDAITDGKKILCGIPQAAGNPQCRTIKYEVDALPATIPSKFATKGAPNKYCFPKTCFPEDFPEIMSHPPKHNNLNAVFNFIINDK